MSKARKHKHKRCHATHQQPSGWALWCLGNRLHGSISPIKEVWVHLGGSWLRLQVGRCTTLQTRRQHQFKDDVSRNHISKIWSPQSSDKWLRNTLHRQMLRALSIKTWNPSQRRYPLSSSDKWPSRDFQQANQEYSSEDSQRDGNDMEGQVTQCTLGIPDSIQDTNWNVPIPIGVREDLPPACWTRVQSTLGHKEMKYGPRCRWRS